MSLHCREERRAHAEELDISLELNDSIQRLLGREYFLPQMTGSEVLQVMRMNASREKGSLNGLQVCSVTIVCPMLDAQPLLDGDKRSSPSAGKTGFNQLIEWFAGLSLCQHCVTEAPPQTSIREEAHELQDMEVVSIPACLSNM